MDITFERNMDLIVISRDGYSLLDWISDIGGIQGILISTVAILLGFWNYNYLDNFIVSKLYRLEKRAIKNQRTEKDDHTEVMTINLFSGLGDYFCDLFPTRIQCCRSSRNERGLALGREKLEKETNIIKII